MSKTEMVDLLVFRYRYSHALETRTRSDSHVFTDSVSVSVDETPGTPGRPSVSVGEEMWWHYGRG